MTDIASIITSYRAGRLTEDAMAEIVAEWPEVGEALSHADKVRAAISRFNADEPTEMVFGKQVRIYARKPILATDCDYEIVTVSGVQGGRVI